ncbi:hypothetical protein NP493_994g02026 [Ridgeia piscesae]|uniref:Cytochrome b5 heme-binding domain-containing protein n=1 Tax=Ridgeia piscesae TaxID=27915 RepID=A0AAD9NKN8_RIDPI|nr:hypothetical protein NP493_994g02026 [Ridgeia piscesae]
MGKQNMTLEQLKAYDGKGTDGKIYVAVNGKIYDVTEKGQHLYGTDGACAVFAGRDASRGVATMAMEVSDKYDDLSDLTEEEREKLHEWEGKFIEKYECIGDLVKS